jgi:hypothetical protein
MSGDPHNRKQDLERRNKSQEEDDDEDDEDLNPAERMLKKSGCLELHYGVQECMAEHKDWRKCKGQVNAFRDCVAKHNKKD